MSCRLFIKYIIFKKYIFYLAIKSEKPYIKLLLLSLNTLLTLYQNSTEFI